MMNTKEKAPRSTRRISRLALLLALPGLGADWPEFRGPTAQGHYHGKPLPTTWSEGKNIRWKTPIPGLGWSSPALVEGRVYLTTAVPEGIDHSLRALCLDAGTGKIIWDVQVFHQDGKTSPPIHSKNSHASPSPIVSGDRIFVHFGHQGTACLDRRGRLVWSNRDIRYAPVHGNGGSPVLVDDLLIFSCDGADQPFVVALDAATGKERWRTPRSWDSAKKFAFCTPLVIEVQGQKQVFLPGAGGAAAYQPSDGQEIWRVRYDGYSVVPRPVYGHGMVFFSTGYDTPSFLAVRVDGRGDVTDTHIVWQLRRGAPLNPSPLLVGDELYLVSDQGLASCVDARTGKVHWQERVPGAYSSSPMWATGGLIYLLNETGQATILRAKPTFEVVARNKINERTLASLAGVDGLLLLRGDASLSA
ncbi:MAG: PQQ-binding-like beta-propeller repeat protein, partial [Gemmataceae bacterium]|nr:PQQ-binding-like beta-propeller repeat protein [Gemmataceae bacterium]